MEFYVRRRTLDEEMREAGKTWNELSWLAQDRDSWIKTVGALCSTNPIHEHLKIRLSLLRNNRIVHITITKQNREQNLVND